MLNREGEQPVSRGLARDSEQPCAWSRAPDAGCCGSAAYHQVRLSVSGVSAALPARGGGEGLEVGWGASCAQTRRGATDDGAPRSARTRARPTRAGERLPAHALRVPAHHDRPKPWRGWLLTPTGQSDAPASGPQAAGHGLAPQDWTDPRSPAQVAARSGMATGDRCNDVDMEPPPLRFGQGISG